MNRIYIRFVLLLLIVSPLVVSASQASNHKHTMPAVMADAIPEGCKDAATTPTIRCSRTPNASFDQHGRLWLVWTMGQHVYVNYSDNKGVSFSRVVKVNAMPENIAARGENRPKIVIDHQGRIFVSWTQKLKKRFSGHIRFSRSVDAGKSFSEPITVNDHRQITSHRFESLAVNNKGEIYIAWLDKRDKLAMKKHNKAYRGAAVYYAVSTDHGKSFQANKKVVDHSCECCRTAMAIDTDQLPVILWRHIFDKNTRDHALIKIKAQDKTSQIKRVSFDNWKIDGCPHHGPAISIADNGIYHLAWFNNAPKRHGLFYANSDDQGQHLSELLSFGNYQAQASHPQILSHGRNLYLVWQEFDGKTNSLVTMSSKDNGKNWSATRRLAQTDGISDYPILLADKHTVYVAWHRPGQRYQLISIK